MRRLSLLGALVFLGAAASPPIQIIVGDTAAVAVPANRGIAVVTVVYRGGERAGRGTEPIAARVAAVRAALAAQGIAPSAIRTRVEIGPTGPSGYPNGDPTRPFGSPNDEPYGVLEVDVPPSMLTKSDSIFVAWQDLFAPRDGIVAGLRNVYRVLDDCSRARDASYRAAVAGATNAGAAFLQSLEMGAQNRPLLVDPPGPDPSSPPLSTLMLCGRSARPPQLALWRGGGDVAQPFDSVRIREYATVVQAGVVQAGSPPAVPARPSDLARVTSDVDIPAYGTARGHVRLGAPFVYAVGTLQGDDVAAAERIGAERAARLARDLGATVGGVAALVAYRQNNTDSGGSPVPRRFFQPPDGTSVGVALHVAPAVRPRVLERSGVRDVPLALMSPLDGVDAPFALDGARVATVETDLPADDEDVYVIIARPVDAAALERITAAAQRIGFAMAGGNGATRVYGSVSRPTDDVLAATVRAIVAAAPSGADITWLVRPHARDCFAFEDRLRPVALAEALGNEARPHAVVAGALHVVRGTCGVKLAGGPDDFVHRYTTATPPLPWTVTARLSVLVQPEQR
jgi:hypothetical protein